MVTDERLAETNLERVLSRIEGVAVRSGVPLEDDEPVHITLDVAELRRVTSDLTELQSLRAQGGVKVQAWETRPQGDEAMEPYEVDVHEGAWAAVMGTNGKPAGWIDTHALFAHQIYRDQVLPLEASPAPVSEEIEAAYRAGHADGRTGGSCVTVDDEWAEYRAALAAKGGQ